jgi:CMP-N-acetylneuraminic acid synthetase
MPAVNTVALLPMKGHSERVPNKNFRRLGGRPLFRWMLDTLLEVPGIAKVVINTDAGNRVLQHGLGNDERVVIRDRRAEICGDLVSMNRVIEDDVRSVPADRYLMTHTTNPLLSAGTVARAMEEFDRRIADASADSLFSVTRIQTRFYRADGSPINHDPDNLIRTQDLEPWFEEKSCVYLFTRESFAAAGARIGRHPALFETPRLESVDIDTEDDWRLVEALVSCAAEADR